MSGPDPSLRVSRVSKAWQHTLASAARFQGLGVHSGQAVTLVVHPAPPDTGIIFERVDISDRDPRIAARAVNVSATQLGTVISNAAGVEISTVEHLMACFAGLEIDNALVRLDGGEAPIMDGSCAPFVAGLDRAGRQVQGRPRRYMQILDPVFVNADGKYVCLLPSPRFEMALEIHFDSAPIGRQALDLIVDEETFREDLADCRTFGFRHEVEALRAAGLARGGSLDNVIVIDGDRVANPEGLRRSDEFVRHKILDALGDLYLLGGPILGRFEGHCSGHSLNNALARALLAKPAAWRWVCAQSDLAEAV